MALFKNDVIRIKFALIKLGFLAKTYEKKLVDEWDNDAKEAYRAFQISIGIYPRQAADAPHSMNGIESKIANVLKESKAELDALLVKLGSVEKAVETKIETVKEEVEKDVENVVDKLTGYIRGTPANAPTDTHTTNQTQKKSSKPKIFGI